MEVVNAADRWLAFKLAAGSGVFARSELFRT